MNEAAAPDNSEKKISPEIQVKVDYFQKLTDYLESLIPKIRAGEAEMLVTTGVVKGLIKSLAEEQIEINRLTKKDKNNQLGVVFIGYKAKLHVVSELLKITNPEAQSVPAEKPRGRVSGLLNNAMKVAVYYFPQLGSVMGKGNLSEGTSGNPSNTQQPRTATAEPGPTGHDADTQPSLRTPASSLEDTLTSRSEEATEEPEFESDEGLSAKDKITKQFMSLFKDALNELKTERNFNTPLSLDETRIAKMTAASFKAFMKVFEDNSQTDDEKEERYVRTYNNVLGRIGESSLATNLNDSRKRRAIDNLKLCLRHVEVTNDNEFKDLFTKFRSANN